MNTDIYYGVQGRALIILKNYTCISIVYDSNFKYHLPTAKSCERYLKPTWKYSYIGLNSAKIWLPKCGTYEAHVTILSYGHHKSAYEVWQLGIIVCHKIKFLKVFQYVALQQFEDDWNLSNFKQLNLTQKHHSLLETAVHVNGSLALWQLTFLRSRLQQGLQTELNYHRLVIIHEALYCSGL